VGTLENFRDATGGFFAFLRANALKAILLSAAFVLILSVIGLQNAPFWDDSMRRLTGVTAWGPWDGRWGSEWFGRLLNAGRPVVDLGLVSFIISGLIMALASLFVVWILVGPRANWLTFVLALAFGLNPWMLNALAFRFDGPFMALAVLFSVSALLFYRFRPLWFFVACVLISLVSANFFQSAIGLVLTLLMTRLLQDWLNRNESTNFILGRLGAGFGGVALGVMLYAIQARLVGTGRADWFDIRHPFGAFANNLYHFIRVFIRDSAPSWLVFAGLVLAVAIFALLRQSRRGVIKPLLAIPVYLILSVLASGGILLFATAEHISVQARFRFPLAMGIAMLAIIASANTESVASPGVGARWPSLAKPMWLVSRLVLVGFAYLWLMVPFLFAQVLGEQHNSLRFQASMIFSDVFSLQQPGDIVIYEPNIFTNTRYAQLVGQRFPIFENSTYVGFLNLHGDNVRDRLTEMLGFGEYQLFATNDKPGICDLRQVDDSQVSSGPRWEAWRADPHTICVTFPALAQITKNTPEVQVIELPLSRFPFAGGMRPNLIDLDLSQVEVAIWSLNDPDDIQWAQPLQIVDGNAQFVVGAPMNGWQGERLVAHFFLNGQFLFQQIWQLEL